MPVHEDGNAAWKEAKAVSELVMGKDRAEIKAILADKREGAYGAELDLMEGGGHNHHVCYFRQRTRCYCANTQVVLSPSDVHNLKTGQRTTRTKISTEDSAHTHYVEVGT